MNPIFLSVLKDLAPIFLAAYNHFTKKHQGVTPTREQLISELEANGDLILAEGAAWRAAHPEPPEPPTP